MLKLSKVIQLLKDNPKRTIRLICSRILLFSRLCLFLKINIGKYKIRFFPTKFGADIWFPKLDISENFSLSFLKEDDIVIDVGANIGVMSLIFRQYINQNGRIFSFEPNPKIYRYLQSNIYLNKLTNIKVYNYAVGEKKGIAYLANSKHDTNNAITNRKENSFKVEMVTLDDVLKEENIKKIKLLKVDTEGYEKFVLNGAKKILPITDIVVFEVIPDNIKRFGYEIEDIINFLKGFNFMIYSIINSDTFKPFSLNEFIKNDSFGYDLFAVKDKSFLNKVKWH